MGGNEKDVSAAFMDSRDVSPIRITFSPLHSVHFSRTKGTQRTTMLNFSASLPVTVALNKERKMQTQSKWWTFKR